MAQGTNSSYRKKNNDKKCHCEHREEWRIELRATSSTLEKWGGCGVSNKAGKEVRKKDKKRAS